MPSRDRKPRRRLRPVERQSLSLRALQAEARVATPADWNNGLRRRVVRCLVERGIADEHAVGIARAYETRPHLIPPQPPKGVR